MLMRAIVYTEYGPPDVLQLKEIEKPVPKDNEVLVKVHATTVTRYDCWARSCTAHTGLGLLMRMWFGFSKPKKLILGTELAGEVEAAGKSVKRLKAGDPVYGYPGMNLGAYAEYACLPKESAARKPSNATYEEAAAVLQGALTALFFLRKANIQRGQKVLIFGASGGVGIYSVQLAKHYFGAEVAGVCSTAKMDLVKSMGADEVIDYTQEDFTQRGETYDVIFDTVGKSTFASSRSLKKNGAYLFATYGLPQIFHILWLTLATSKRALSPLLDETTEDLILLRELIEAGTIKPVVEAGLKKGGVVITM
jgi:NADPH:quinone reductase-like Zn-dependent oxidoreductase